MLCRIKIDGLEWCLNSQRRRKYPAVTLLCYAVSRGPFFVEFINKWQFFSRKVTLKILMTMAVITTFANSHSNYDWVILVRWKTKKVQLCQFTDVFFKKMTLNYQQINLLRFLNMFAYFLYGKLIHLKTLEIKPWNVLMTFSKKKSLA